MYIECRALVDKKRKIDVDVEIVKAELAEMINSAHWLVQIDLVNAY